MRDNTFERRRPKVLVLLLLSFPGLTHAGAMAPLRVDPALLGGRTIVAPAASAAGGVAPAMSARPEISDGRTTVRAQNIRGLRSVEVIAEGQAEIVRDDLKLTADRLSYNELTDEINVEGNVRLQNGDDVITSERGRLVVFEQTGEFVAPEYAFALKSVSKETGVERTIIGRGSASMVRFEGENQYVVENATWTTCKPESSDWYIKAGSIDLDYDSQVGVAKSSSLVFKGVPLLYWPSMSFPLGDQRKSGFLIPTIAASEKTGFDLAVPYYWNIAPNYDATLVPRLMTKRGLQLGAEVRYLGENYEGQSRLEWLANDKITGEARGLASIQHRHQLTNRLRASLNFNGVTDDEYFEDLSSTLQVSSRRNLLREGRLDYSGSWWNASALVQSYQTLRDDIDAPYKRLPQLTLNARKVDLPGGFEFAFESEYVDFQHRDDAFNQGKRTSAYPQIALNIRRPGWYIKPKIGAHYTRYDLDTPYTLNPGRTAITRSLPIFSLDAGMYFDRESSLFGRDTLQTLEPRIYYVRIPYRDQDDIPLFDTSRYDFGFAQIFSENRYSGIDRIGDANQITAALTTRFIESNTGIERMRATVAQRFYREDRRVGIGTEVLDDTRTDLLATFSGRISRSLSLDLATQYSPQTQNTQRTNVRLRFQPDHLKVLNVGYRYRRGDGLTTDDLRDVDLSGQWPLGGRWYGVGRVTRSLEEKRTTEALLGLEYVSRCGCWAMRTAVHRFAINPNDVNTALFFQLELTGLGGIGSNPSSLIRRSVPGYGVINEPVSDRYFGN